MWEQLQVPVVPLVSFGAFDLFPKRNTCTCLTFLNFICAGEWINTPGHVVIRYLPPIIPPPGTSREALLFMVRRAMLAASKDCPASIMQPLSWYHRFCSLLSSLALFAADVWIYRSSRHLLIDEMHYSAGSVLLWLAITSAVITIGLYVYYVYVIDLVSARRGGENKTKKEQ